LIAIGNMVSHFEATASILSKQFGHEVTVINARFVKPLDTELLLEAARTHEYLFTAEDNVLAGGFGSAVNELFAEGDTGKSAMRFGIPDRFIEHGSPDELFEELGLTPARLAERVLRHVSGQDV
ncbi:1-deoxy-D-xylulose-5-phosphate synthase, partial [Candidatus Poribacteria bacterium]|nr:1-deoxy-D-xylulose-5-phosphate synthase [Candidatus Poribacteria bacterium]